MEKKTPYRRLKEKSKCDYCGMSFFKLQPNQRFCTMQCRRENKQKNYYDHPEINCKNCGKIFKKKYVRHIFCSQKCGREFRLRQWKNNNE